MADPQQNPGYEGDFSPEDVTALIQTKNQLQQSGDPRWQKLDKFIKSQVVKQPQSTPEQGGLSRAWEQFRNVGPEGLIKGMMPSSLNEAAMNTMTFGGYSGAKQLVRMAKQAPAAEKELLPLTGIEGSKAFYKSAQDIHGIMPELGGTVAGLGADELLMRAGPKAAEVAKPIAGKVLETTGSIIKSKPGKAVAGLGGMMTGAAAVPPHPWIGAGVGYRLASGMAESTGKWLKDFGSKYTTTDAPAMSPLSGPKPGTVKFDTGDTIRIEGGQPGTTAQNPLNEGDVFAGGVPRYGLPIRDKYMSKSVILYRELGVTDKRMPYGVKYGTIAIPGINEYSDATGVQISKALDLKPTAKEAMVWQWNKYRKEYIEPDANRSVPVTGISQRIAQNIDPSNYQIPGFQEQLKVAQDNWDPSAGSTTLGELADRVTELNNGIRGNVLSPMQKAIAHGEIDAIRPVLDETLTNSLRDRIAGGAKYPYGPDSAWMARQIYGSIKELVKDLDGLEGYSLKKGSLQGEGAPSRGFKDKDVSADAVVKDVFSHTKGSGAIRPPITDYPPRVKPNNSPVSEGKPAAGPSGEAGAKARPKVIQPKYTLGGKEFTGAGDMKTNLAKLQDQFNERRQEMAARNATGELSSEQFEKLFAEFEKAQKIIQKGVKVQMGNAIHESGPGSREVEYNEDAEYAQGGKSRATGGGRRASQSEAGHGGESDDF